MEAGRRRARFGGRAAAGQQGGAEAGRCGETARRQGAAAAGHRRVARRRGSAAGRRREGTAGSNSALATGQEADFFFFFFLISFFHFSFIFIGIGCKKNYETFSPIFLFLDVNFPPKLFLYLDAKKNSSIFFQFFFSKLSLYHQNFPFIFHFFSNFGCKNCFLQKIFKTFHFNFFLIKIFPFSPNFIKIRQKN